jgi:SAM-dependent methyltransferase
MKSYAVTRLGIIGRITEAWTLYRSHTCDVPKNVRSLLEQAREAEAKIASLLGTSVTGRKVLEIGPGQQLVQLAYFARQNEAVGIDLDLVLQHLDLPGCIRMARRNGWIRTCKTVARKCALIDRKVRTEVVHQLGLREMPRLQVLQMDATNLLFPDDHFDIVTSRAAFEHFSDPAAVISEIRRVLKPGGVMFVNLHLFSSDSGCHDTRILAGKRGELPFWAHLRPQHHDAIHPNSYLNCYTLADWRQLFQSQMPGSEVVALCDAGDAERRELSKLRSEGELASYSDEELLTVTLEVRWRKPVRLP